MERIGFAPPRATDSIGGIDPQAGDHVGMVGLFTPLLKQVTAAGAQLTVIELNPDYAGHYDGYRVTLDAAALEDCNKVLSTSTILLNHTVDDMLAHCRKARRIVLIGPSAGCLPEPLFARGVTVVGGSWITDRAGFIDALRAVAEEKETLVFLCRSGKRSDAAATAAAAAGFGCVLNVIGGFEGDLDEQGQRGKLGGWRKAGLPWKQG